MSDGFLMSMGFCFSYAAPTVRLRCRTARREPARGTAGHALTRPRVDFASTMADPSTTLPEILELKRTLDGQEKRFACRLIEGDRHQAVVLFISPAAMHVHGIELPAGTVTFGHFWTERLYNVYHWLGERGQTIAFYFNLADRTVIADEAPRVARPDARRPGHARRAARGAGRGRAASGPRRGDARAHRGGEDGRSWTIRGA